MDPLRSQWDQEIIRVDVVTVTSIIRDVYCPAMSDIAGFRISLLEEEHKDGTYRWWMAGQKDGTVHWGKVSVSAELLKDKRVAKDHFVRALSNECKGLAHEFREAADRWSLHQEHIRVYRDHRG